MNLFENSFFVLRASQSDSRRRLHALCDEKNLFSPSEKADAALRNLTHPLKRLDAEIRWLPGCSPEEIKSIVLNLQRCSASPNCSIKDIMIVRNSTGCFSYLNQLLTLLPQFPAAEIDEIILNAAKQFDEISMQNTMEVINAERDEAGFSLVDDPVILEAALQSYKEEIVVALDKRISLLAPAEYDVLIRRIAAFGTSPIIESAIRRYELSVSDKLDSAEAEVSCGADTLERFFAKDLHAGSVASVKTAVSAWCSMIEPLQIFSRTIGTESITATRENAVYSRLADCGKELLNQNTTLYAVEIYRCLKMVVVQTARFESLSGNIDKVIENLDEANAELLKKQNDEFERLSAQAWEEEQRRNDDLARARSREHSQKEQERISRKRKEQDDDIAILQARYKQIKKAEETQQQAERKTREAHELVQKKDKVTREAKKARYLFRKRETKN